MIKNRSICMVLACAAVATGAFPAFAGLPTIDAGNIAGTIGIVTQGATGIQQGIETIANGSNLNSIIGDAAGTLAKFNEKYGDDIKKGIKAAQDAQKRINEGLDAYNKYQGEIAARKAEYDALMETVSSYTGGSSYEDAEFDGEDFEEEYIADYDSGYDTDYDAESVSTLEAVDNRVLISNVSGNALEAVSLERQLPAAEGEFIARQAVTGNKISADELKLQKSKAEMSVVGDGLAKKADLTSTAVADGLMAKKASISTDLVKESAKIVDVEKVTEAAPSITNETTGRKRFGDIRASGVVKANKNNALQKATLSSVKSDKIVVEKSAAINKVSVEPSVRNGTLRAVEAPVAAAPAAAAQPASARQFRMSPTAAPAQKLEKASAIDKVSVEPSVRNGALRAVEAPVAAAPAAAAQPASARQFRMSPTAAPAQKLEKAPAMKIEKVSSSAITFSSRMAFASENEDNTKGVGYDSNGTFISPLAQRCGVSINDLQDSDKLKACTEKIVRENFAKNQYDAINNRKDCERMIYNTVVALLAETTQQKYEASNYGDTLDEQEKLSGDATNTRDDSAVIAMANEQTQILLNRMSLLISTQIILDSVQQLCAAPKDVLKEINTDDNKADATDGGK